MYLVYTNRKDPVHADYIYKTVQDRISDNAGKQFHSICCHKANNT